MWPLDLNRDGISDLVSTASSGRIQVSIGKGDGTFQPPIETTTQGAVLNTADFNLDGRPDVVALRISPQGNDVVILPGTGTATPGAPIIVVRAGALQFGTFAVSADFDGDGRRDLVLSGGGFAVNVFPGNGDFTFKTPIALVPSGAAVDAITADLNNDGRIDVITANGEGFSVSVFLNRGSFTFTSSDMPQSHAVTDVTVADFNRDGRIDLLAAAGRHPDDSGPGNGEVLAFRGNGDGTFAAPVAYGVLPGPMQIVAGDFNRDGLVDVATGNQSSIVVDDCGGPTVKQWDTVSVLVGHSDGTFSGGNNFSVGDQSLLGPGSAQGARYTNTLVSLNTSDLNGDRAVDLIASNGAILFNIPAATNRPPIINAGTDTVVVGDNQIVLSPAASDPDEDVLTYEIRDSSGFIVARYPNACTSTGSTGDQTYTVTVNDGHGHSASDSVVYTFVLNGNGVGQFTDGRDVGQVAAAGSDTFDPSTGTYTVRGSGRDIWDNADEFRYVWTLGQGDFQITARVDSVQNVNVWTKAGVMIRENLNAGSRHASLLATPGRGVSFQRRTVENGASTLTAGPATTAPVWLKLDRSGDVITAFYRKTTTDAWTLIDRQTLSSLRSEVLVGLAVTSHADGMLATGTFSNVTIETTLPFTGTAIGNGSGSFTHSGPVFTVTGRGADVWGTADAFFYVSIKRSLDVTITARVQSLSNTDVWAKAGVMIREDLTPGSRHVMMVATPGRGVSFQYRPAPGAASLQAPNQPGVAPVWVRLSLKRATNMFTGWWSVDGEQWNAIDSVNVNFAATDFYVGLPVTSHNTSATTTAVFDDVTVTTP
ncbi:MAG TPA: FG-GAP-like repeat-containing protein [Vicinamibacterales bacterium]